MRVVNNIPEAGVKYPGMLEVRKYIILRLVTLRIRGRSLAITRREAFWTWLERWFSREMVS